RRPWRAVSSTGQSRRTEVEGSPTTSRSLMPMRMPARSASQMVRTRCTVTRSGGWSSGNIAEWLRPSCPAAPARDQPNALIDACRASGLASEERLLELRLDGLFAEPDPKQCLVESRALDRPLGFSVPADPGRSLDKVQRYD